jgi:hypothetical protein
MVEIPLASRVTAFITHMDEICERLSSCGSLMKIRSLSAKGVGCHHRLRPEAVSADWTAELYLTKRCHGIPLQYSPLIERGNFCAMQRFHSKALSLLLEISCKSIFSHPLSASRSTPYHEPGC